MRFVLIALAVVSVLVLCQSSAAGATAGALERAHDPVIVLGQACPSFGGATLGQLFLYA
jgi:hypothetical protein